MSPFCHHGLLLWLTYCKIREWIFIVTLVHCVLSRYQHLIPDSWLWLWTFIYPPLIVFLLCISTHLSLFLLLTQASNNIVPLGLDKCGCCDKELGEGKMQSVSISSHCHSSSDPLVDRNIVSIDVQYSMAGICDLQRMRSFIDTYLCYSLA